jgi:hypothetical protein
MSHPARDPRESAGIDGKTNRANGRRTKIREPQVAVEDAR